MKIVFIIGEELILYEGPENIHDLYDTWILSKVGPRPKLPPNDATFEEHKEWNHNYYFWCEKRNEANYSINEFVDSIPGLQKLESITMDLS